MKVSLEMRQAVKAEAAKSKKPMSAAAAKRLQETKQRDIANRAANARLLEAFYQTPLSVERVMDFLFVLQRGRTTNIRKRSVKATHFLSRGFRLYAVHDLIFLGELLPEEEGMSLTRILEKYPMTEVKAEAPTTERRCSLGARCLRVRGRQAARVSGSAKKYCSVACKGQAARARRGQRPVQINR